jgi:enoyl-CoA hydratase/carnithine racemase
MDRPQTLLTSGTVRLARIVGRTVAAEMIFDGRPLRARRLHELGAVNRVVETGRATEVALAWAAELAERPPAPLRVMKQLLDETADLPLADALRIEQERFQANARSGEAAARLDAVQARFDAGEAIRAVYGEPARQTHEDPEEREP